MPASLSSSISDIDILPPRPLTVLHTSDWHLGRRLYGRMRYEEFEAFLAWLYDTIISHQIEVLIVAGDIFDTMTPSNQAQALYYEFLGKVSVTCCQHIVIVAGNHDSPTFLDAPSKVLKFLNVHVIGTACEDLADEVLVLHDRDNQPQCIIAAVPYLRDRDVRSSRAGESADSKDANVIKGIRTHYDEVASIAKEQQAELIKIHHRRIPIIATGHLFAAGGKTTDDDGVRELYVGNLGQVSADTFADCFDYVALGHLHVPQRVGGCEHIRYSGSPIAMGFGEAKQQKQVLLVQFGAADGFNNEHESQEDKHANATIESAPSQLASKAATVKTATAKKPIEKTVKKTVGQAELFMDDLFGFDESLENKQVEKTIVTNLTSAQQEQKNQSLDTDIQYKTLHHDESNQMQVVSLPIPKFQHLAQISGDLAAIEHTIQSLSTTDSIWLEVIYTGDEIVSDLREQVHAMVDGLPCEVLKIKNTRTYNKVLNQQQTSETLQDLNEMDVFESCLTLNAIPDSQKDALRNAYGQILHDLQHEDKQAK